ncbi:MAG: histidyl-tRNA synthetase, partial [Bradyrhizobium sp.]|nr:histidyl-tRNA synthetase [Bradyrhizobium sp.]
DRGPAEIAATRRMTETIREVYERYGFEPVETPTMEFTDALGKFLPDQDRPNEGVFSFQDDDEQWISLRYDLTAPLARYVAENFDSLPKPYRSYRAGYVYRNEKPGPGRFRQFMQFDADTVGSASPAADAEMCMMAADAIEALGIERGSYVVKVWNRKCLDGILEGAGDSPEKNLVALRAIDKKDKIGLIGVQQLLDEGRWEGGEPNKGDFTRGAGMSVSANNFITATLTFSGARAGDFVYDTDNLIPREKLKEAETAPRQPFDFETFREKLENNLQGRPFPSSLDNGLAELREMDALISAAGYNGRIVIDETVVRGLEYYTGPVYEVELLLDATDEKGRPVRFGSVGGGGRYDGLVSRFRGEPVPATGFSIGVSRLVSALKLMNSPLVSAKDIRGPVVVLVLDKDQVPAYQRMVTQLRTAGIRSELYLGAAGMNAQLKYADRRHSPCAVIQGSNERDKGEVSIRDLVLGAELAASTKDRSDYLDLRQRAQFSVSENKLVEAVMEVLGRHG